jgi:hypothetical protein
MWLKGNLAKIIHDRGRDDAEIRGLIGGADASVNK